VDTAGNVYATDVGINRVVKLVPGSSTPTVLPFTGPDASLWGPVDLAGDTAGNVYIADLGNNRVVKLARAECAAERRATSLCRTGAQ
jgi:serine/threonine-protein kinase